MKYIDTNIFVLPAIYATRKAIRARQLVESIPTSDTIYTTSSLTLDEIVWNVLKIKKDRERAIQLCKYIIELPNLRILDVTVQDIQKALWFMKKYQNLQPRDSIHLAVCVNANIPTIISDDSDFDAIQEIQRQGLDRN